jgi:hypothetical protein
LFGTADVVANTLIPASIVGDAGTSGYTGLQEGVNERCDSPGGVMNLWHASGPGADRGDDRAGFLGMDHNTVTISGEMRTDLA